MPNKPVIERMSTERCAKLMAVGMVNNLDEVWISENPYLLLVYLNQYLPNFFRWYVAHCKNNWFCVDIVGPHLVKTQLLYFKIPVFLMLWHIYQNCFIMSFLSPGFLRSSLWK